MNVQNFKLRKPQKITMVGQCIFPATILTQLEKRSKLLKEWHEEPAGVNKKGIFWELDLAMALLSRFVLLSQWEIHLHHFGNL